MSIRYRIKKAIEILIGQLSLALKIDLFIVD